MEIKGKKYINGQEVMLLLGIKRSSLEQYKKDGIIKAININPNREKKPRYFYAEADIIDLLNSFIELE